MQSLRRAGVGEGADVTLLHLATVLEAWSAAIKRSPQATALLEKADSAVRGWRVREETLSLILGHAWSELGRPEPVMVPQRDSVLAELAALKC